MSLKRNYREVTVVGWIDENHFVGTLNHGRPNRPTTIEACYGWSKGAGFFIYTIGDGHIEKVGSVKRTELIEKLMMEV